MQHRHLLPDEIDQLLDGETGFGVAPLRAHVETCAECAAKIADARVVVEALERLPHFAPNARFADKVMAQVQVVEPWHVAAMTTARTLVPQSKPMRVLMGATASVAAVTLSGSALWLATRADIATYIYNLAADRARGALLNGAASVIGDTFGQPALDAIRTGGVTGLAVGAGVVTSAAVIAAFGYRRLAVASRRSQE
jgi:hypothetical protein